MKTSVLIWNFIAFTLFGFSNFCLGQTNSKQDFETEFNIANYPDEFLSGWSANQIRSGKSRVFQASAEGIADSQALAIQTTSTFNAQIYIKTLTVGLKKPTISFWAKTGENGSGNRPVLVYLSYSTDQGKNFSARNQIGSDTTFLNKDTPYREYKQPIPEIYWHTEDLTLKLEVDYGEGSGTAARLFLDDFNIGTAEEKSAALNAKIIPTANDSSLLLDFDQEVSLISEIATLSANYGQPFSITQPQSNQLLLHFDDYIYNNDYRLLFKEIKSLQSDLVFTDWSISFEHQKATPEGTLVINEIMPDPNPKGLIPENPILPNAEFIEIFNQTEKAIKLSNFTYNDATIPQILIQPQEHLILCAAPHQELFQHFGKVAGMEAFPTLVNSAGEILLNDGFGNLIDSLSYDQSLYADKEKEKGGWSIERINPFLDCNDPSNWKASAAAEGGTPGKTNNRFSEVADQRIFEILEIKTLSSLQIQLSFSKILPSVLATATKISLNDQATRILEHRQNFMLLQLSNPMLSGESYTLSVQSLLDCYSLPLSENTITFVYDGQPPKAKKVGGIDESTIVVEFNEAVDPISASKPSNYQLISQVEIAYIPAISEKAANVVQIGLSKPLLLGETYSLSLSNIADQSGNQMHIDTIFFVWEDVLDTVMMLSPNSLKVIYSAKISGESATNQENYLAGESQMHPIKVLKDPEETNAYILFFDAEFPENKAQQLLVQNMVDSDGKDRITLQKTYVRDTRPIELENLEIPDNNSLLLTFNKALDPERALLSQVYSIVEMNEAPYALQMTNENQVLLSFTFEWITGAAYHVNIDGLEDLYGKKLEEPIKRQFIWDTLPPIIDTAYLTNPYSLVINLSKSIASPDSLLINNQLFSMFELSDGGEKITVFNEEAWVVGLLSINLPTVSSKNGELGKALHFSVDNRLLYVTEATIWDAESVLIFFSRFYEPSTVLFSAQYLVQGQPPLDVIQVNPYQVKLKLNTALKHGENITVQVEPEQVVADNSDYLFQTVLDYNDGILEIWLENNQQIIINHELALEELPWLEPFSFLEENFKPEPFLNQSYRKQIQILISPPLPQGHQLTLKIPPRKQKNQQILPGSQRTISWNPSAPQLLEVVVLPENQLALFFDKALDPVLAIVPQFYSISEQNPHTVTLEENGKLVILSFESTWANNLALTLHVQQLEDLDGNEIAPIEFDFFYKEITVAGNKDIIINEVMPAPKEGNSLPNAEYIEIFNPTDSTFNLGGMQLANSRTKSVLARTEMKPGEYIILCPASSEATFSKYGKVIGLSHWPTLLNGGDEISLLNQKEELVDKMSYHPELPLASEVLTNGYSWELINPWSTCEGPSNYAPASIEAKGTPGFINSVFDDSPDRSSPQLLGSLVSAGNQILLQFSKPSAHETENRANFKIVPTVKISNVYQDPNDPLQWILNLEEHLEENQAYEITVDNWRDCSGNLLDNNKTLVKIPGNPEEGDVVLNEVLFNPPTGAPKFVEIYNNSSKLINLKNWKLANFSNGEIDNRKILASDDFIIDPFTYLVLTTDSQSLRTYFPKAVNSNFLEMSLPSYPIRSGSVILLDPEENWPQRFDYDEDYHHGFLRDVKGVSLERYASGEEVNDPKNWHSAAVADNHATPGYKNSQVYDGNTGGVGLTISPKIFIPDATGEQPFTTISYKMDQPNYQATLRIFAASGLEVKLLCQNELWAANGFYTWDGTNEQGEKVGIGYYIVSAELIHPGGHVQHIKKTVVVGTKF
ncbi:lamin tail domain-containing protein [Cyclobacterium marinum]|uniref:lamin tail domain-containing protein n=1 Tax=Cyclobacterium marinum TaxID=104 RepID=UPI0011EE3491|nr:lamin tail domain-containing protein [Cyclobacterium marinum]MBI0401114.1 lamin tail domain-containing protein [Cyclobacterium marinum]